MARHGALTGVTDSTIQQTRMGTSSFVVFNITGDSYRMRTHRAHAAKLRHANDHQPTPEEATPAD